MVCKWFLCEIKQQNTTTTKLRYYSHCFDAKRTTYKSMAWNMPYRQMGPDTHAAYIPLVLTYFSEHTNHISKEKIDRFLPWFPNAIDVKLPFFVCLFNRFLLLYICALSLFSNGSRALLFYAMIKHGLNHFTINNNRTKINCDWSNEAATMAKIFHYRLISGFMFAPMLSIKYSDDWFIIELHFTFQYSILDII